MAMLADLERLFERIFERSTARLFRAHLQAVQLERRVERSMERARSSHDNRTTVPSRYRVRLHPADLEEIALQSGGPEALAGRLADASLAFARSHGYHLPGRPSVALVADPAVQRGVIEVDAVGAPAGPASSAAGLAPSAPVPVPDVPVVALRPGGPGPAPNLAPADAWGPTSAPQPTPAPAPASPPVAPAAPVEPAMSAPRAGGIRGDGTETLVFRRPAPAPMHAVLRIIGRDGSERTIEVDGTPLTLGRAADNGLVVADPRVSRHHARLQARRGTLVLRDLGSTNGSRVNGVRVDECALGMGDRVLVGDTVLLVEQLPG